MYLRYSGGVKSDIYDTYDSYYVTCGDGDYVEVGKYKTRRTLCEGVILPLGTLSLLVAVADTVIFLKKYKEM